MRPAGSASATRPSTRDALLGDDEPVDHQRPVERRQKAVARLIARRRERLADAYRQQRTSRDRDGVRPFALGRLRSEEARVGGQGRYCGSRLLHNGWWRWFDRGRRSRFWKWLKGRRSGRRRHWFLIARDDRRRVVVHRRRHSGRFFPDRCVHHRCGAVCSGAGASPGGGATAATGGGLVSATTLAVWVGWLAPGCSTTATGLASGPDRIGHVNDPRGHYSASQERRYNLGIHNAESLKNIKRCDCSLSF